VKVVVDNLIINYNRLGKGPKVLLIHGWGDNLNGLTELAKGIAKGFEVIAIDLPGFGDSEGPKTAWSLMNYAELVQHFLEKLEINALYGAIGHSHGGAVLVKATGQKILNPKKLILLAAAGIRDKQKGRRLFLMILAKTGNLATIWMPARYREALRKSLYQAAGSDQDVMPGLKETYRLIVKEDLQPDAALIDQSTLLIYSTGDKAAPLEFGKIYNRLIKNSKLEVVDQAGHFIHLDQPEKTYNLIRKFLDAKTTT
jgi:pimeloyl-ACP methyl ester carboxylesterase